MNRDIYTTDTTPESLAVQLEGLRSTSPRQRLQKAIQLSEDVRQMGLAALLDRLRQR